MDKLSEDAEVKLAEEAMAKVDVAIVEAEVEKVVELYKDGFQVSDIWNTLDILTDVAKLMQDTTGAEKKEFVLEAFKKVYERLDPDISSWVPQWLEKKAVFYVIDGLAPSAIDWMVGKKKKAESNGDT